MEGASDRSLDPLEVRLLTSAIAAFDHLASTLPAVVVPERMTDLSIEQETALFTPLDPHIRNVQEILRA